MILHNGVIWTVDSKNSTAQAVAIKDGKFVAVGSNQRSAKLRGPQTQVIDLRGRFVTPGFNDNHVHFASAAQFLEFNIMAVVDAGAICRPRERRDLASAQRRMDRRRVLGRVRPMGRGQRRQPATRAVCSRHEIGEAITADYPMFIRKFDDSQFAANRAALRAAGVDPDNPQAPDVEFLKDSQGRFNGHMRGKGVTRLFSFGCAA